MTIDVDRLAREHVASVHREFPSAGGRITSYQFSPAQLTAYTRKVMEECAKACETRFPKMHTWASENSDRYHIQDETVLECSAAIRRMMP